MVMVVYQTQKIHGVVCTRTVVEAIRMTVSITVVKYREKRYWS